MKRVLFFIHLAAIVPVVCVATAKADTDDQQKIRHDPALPIDPTYKEVAEKTRGKVYDMRTPEARQAFQETLDQANQRRRHENFRNHFLFSENQKLALYIYLKWCAYAGWCFVGLGALMMKKRYAQAALWGTIRVILGIGFGATLFFLFLAFGAAPSGMMISYVTIYVLVYVPVRWMEWSIMSAAMQLPLPSTRWRLGGIAVSCLTDVAQMLLVGALIPHGRFLC